MGKTELSPNLHAPGESPRAKVRLHAWVVALLLPSLTFAHGHGGGGGGHAGSSHGSVSSGGGGSIASHSSGSHSHSTGTSSKSWSSSKPIYVHGYTRKDGSHVSGFYRAEPGQGADRETTSMGVGYAERESAGQSVFETHPGEHRIKTRDGLVYWSKSDPKLKNGSYVFENSGTVVSLKSTEIAFVDSHPTVKLSGGFGRPANSANPEKQHPADFCEACQRDSHGRIRRSEEQKEAFMRLTGFPHGRKGYVVDHITPLACGGADAPSNMQWQTVEAAALKDTTERGGCGR